MKQFGREILLKIGNEDESLTYSNLRITFNVTKTISSEPNTGEITIYNLNQNTRNLITTKYYQHVELYICYREDDFRLIFKGDVISINNSQSDLDIITHLKCADGFKAYTDKTIVKTLSSGQSDIVVVNETLASFNIQAATIDLPRNTILPRGKVLFCDAREAVSKVAINNRADWSIQDGQLAIIPKNTALRNDEGYIISSATGMIGSPEKNDDGLEVTTLCNPYFKIGGLIRIESQIKEYNGNYKIKSIQHEGDLMGSDWKSKLVCTGGNFVIKK